MRAAALAGFLALCVSVVLPSQAEAAPGQVNVQGALRDATGALMEGPLTVTLRIYAGQTGGTALWTETRTLDVSGGLFSALLPGNPTGNPFPASLFGTGQKRWLGVQPQGQLELPRTPLVSVPYALHAGTAGVSSALDCVGCVTVTMIDPAVLDAALLVYDNLTSGLVADTAQEAIDELAALYHGLDASLSAVARSGKFTDLTAVPAGLADGDDDLLAGMACSNGQIPKRAGGAWACGTDVDTKLTEAQVDTYVANNGYALAASLARIATTGAWADLTGVPASIADGDQDTLGALACTNGKIARRTAGVWACSDDIDTKLTEAQVDTYVANNGYAAASSLATVATSGKFSDLLSIPAGLADGDNDLLAGMTCANGQIPKRTATGWQCGTDVDTKLSEAQVDAFVSNNGYALSSSLARIATTGAWADLSGIPADIANGDADTLGALACPEGQVAKRIGGIWKCSTDIDTRLTEAQVDAYANNNGYARAADLAQVALSGNFSHLLGIPAGLLDGDQDTLGGLSCANGQIAVRDATGWKCGTDKYLSQAQVDAYVSNNGYALSSSLATVATTGRFSDLTNIPAGLSDGDNDMLAGIACAAGQVIKYIGGAWRCADDTAGGGGGGGGSQEPRSYFVVLGLRAATYCPSGYNVEPVSNVYGPNGWLYINIQEHGLSLASSNGNGYGYEGLWVQFHNSEGISHVCWKEYKSSSGKPHASVLTMAGGNASSCPSGYHYIPRSHTQGNNSWGYVMANEGGMYLGYVNSWWRADHAYGDDGGEQSWWWTTHIDTICYRIYGVDEDPATAAGVYPVFMGLRSNSECPAGWNARATSQMDRTDGWFYMMYSPNASYLGGHYSWEHNGSAGAQVHYHNTHVYNVCWRYFVRTTLKPTVLARTQRSGACPSGYVSLGATNAKGWNNYAYEQITSFGAYFGGLYSWNVWDHADGYIRQTWTSQLTNRICFKVQNVQ